MSTNPACSPSVIHAKKTLTILTRYTAVIGAREGTYMLRLMCPARQVAQALADCGLGGGVMSDLMGLIAAIIHLGDVEVPTLACGAWDV